MTTDSSRECSRWRMTMSITAVAVAGVMLSACGSAASDSDSAAGRVDCLDTSGDSVAVGSINSLSGGTAVSEVVIHDAITLAVEQINADGGVLGKQLRQISEDGASDPAIFAQKAQKLVASDCVAAVFGGYTSASRKAMLPVFEDTGALLYYGQQYEGLESSPNIFYTGATTNQQIIPSLDYLREQGVKSIYLVGSDYVFPRTSNAIVRAYAEENGMTIAGEDYAPLGSTDFSTIVNKIRRSDADAVFNVVVGDSLAAFFREYNNVGLNASTMPVMSMCVGEEEVRSIGAQNLVGQLSSWNYYQSLDNPVNDEFVAAFKERFGSSSVTSDPMESAYTAVHLWKQMVEKADTFTPEEVSAAAAGVSYEAPEGLVTVDGENHHVTKTARIGRVTADGQFDVVWSSDGPIEPDPFLDSYPWAEGVGA
ncbi:urea ABC transporter substrate-binding protein [Gordonia hongkongensis]|uniref:urea ABC transporter substrate-binding protein n=1 Tax=Gordonia hongkongensis TaxID=1701090 RepID=UPI003EBFB17C